MVSHNALRKKKQGVFFFPNVSGRVKQGLWVGKKQCMCGEYTNDQISSWPEKNAASARRHKHTFTQLHNQQHFLQKVQECGSEMCFHFDKLNHTGCMIYWCLISYPLILGFLNLCVNIGNVILHAYYFCIYCHLTFIHTIKLLILCKTQTKNPYYYGKL